MSRHAIEDTSDMDQSDNHSEKTRSEIQWNFYNVTSAHWTWISPIYALDRQDTTLQSAILLHRYTTSVSIQRGSRWDISFYTDIPQIQYGEIYLRLPLITLPRHCCIKQTNDKKIFKPKHPITDDKKTYRIFGVYCTLKYLSDTPSTQTAEISRTNLA